MIVLNLCAISVDRYLAVTQPVRYRSLMTAKRAKYIIAVVWILSFIICFPLVNYFFGWLVIDEKRNQHFFISFILLNSYIPFHFQTNKQKNVAGCTNQRDSIGSIRSFNESRPTIIINISIIIIIIVVVVIIIVAIGMVWIDHHQWTWSNQNGWKGNVNYNNHRKWIESIEYRHRQYIDAIIRWSRKYYHNDDSHHHHHHHTTTTINTNSTIHNLSTTIISVHTRADSMCPFPQQTLCDIFSIRFILHSNVCDDLLLLAYLFGSNTYVTCLKTGISDNENDRWWVEWGTFNVTYPSWLWL